MSRLGRTVAAMVLVFPTSLAAAPATAGGGGHACADPVTEANGKTVRMAKNCFSPTILRAAPGSTITWVNEDPYQHTVTGAQSAWGDEDAIQGTKRAGFTFETAGIYLYSCLFHPGMIGAVVVGDSTAAGTASETIELPEEPGLDEAVPELPTRTPDVAAASDQAEEVPWPAVTLGLGALTGGVGFGIGRVRRRAQPES